MNPYDRFYAVQRFSDRRIPLHVWAMVAIGVAGFIVILITR
jgi:hypothetical protein